MPDTIAAPALMDADTFLPWALARGEKRWELHDGEAVRMPAERAVHGRVKFAAAMALRDAVRQSGLEAEAFVNSLAVRIDDRTVFQPDALLRPGPRLDDDIYVIADPVIVVEVTSPSTEHVDTIRKLAGYFRLPSIHHYLILDPRQRLVVHHARDGADIRTRILSGGAMQPDPPGIALPLDGLFD